MNYTIIASNSNKSKNRFLVHKTGCVDVAREVKRFHGGTHEVEADTVEEAINENLNEFYSENGYKDSHYSVARCAK